MAAPASALLLSGLTYFSLLHFSHSFKQTRGDGGTLFFVYQCWQDALRKMLAILKERSCEFRGARVHVGQIYEHCWGERSCLFLNLIQPC